MSLHIVLAKQRAEKCYWIGPRYPANVLPEHACLASTDEDTAGIRAASICQSDAGGGYATFSMSCGISGTHRDLSFVMAQEEQELDKWTWVEERERASGQGRDARQWRGGMLTLEPWVGNVKLLETATTCSQVLSSGGEPNGEIAGELYAKLPRGMSFNTFRCIHNCGETD